MCRKEGFCSKLKNGLLDSNMKSRLLALLVIIAIPGDSMAVEEPSFEVVKKTDVYEIRAYKPTLVAETKVEAGFEEAGNRAFRVLADYIFGNNKSQSKIEMTTPVAQVKSEKIAMTAPVGMKKEDGGYLVQFTMPAKFTLKTLPQPNDPRVNIREISARKVAVLRYSGTWSESSYKEKLSQLRNALAHDGLKTRGEPVFARFNPPFWPPWFMRRNEIWIELSD